jgi:hypothetical protein
MSKIQFHARPAWLQVHLRPRTEYASRFEMHQCCKCFGRRGVTEVSVECIEKSPIIPTLYGPQAQQKLKSCTPAVTPTGNGAWSRTTQVKGDSEILHGPSDRSISAQEARESGHE